jgi:hypothetical protein
MSDKELYLGERVVNKMIVWGLVGMLLLAACSSQTATVGGLEIEKTTGDQQIEPALAEVSPSPEPTTTETTIDEVESSDFESDDARSAFLDVEEALDKSSPLPEGVLMVLQRSGGIAGIEEQWVIFVDGRVEGSGGRGKSLNSEELEVLRTIIEVSGFSEMADSYVPLDACCDLFTYSITVNTGDGQSKTVTTIDGSSKQPQELTGVLNVISQVLFVD